MNIIQCDKSHYYDSDAYSVCPHCFPGAVKNAVPPQGRSGAAGTEPAKAQNPAAGMQRGQNPAAGAQWGQNPAAGAQRGQNPVPGMQRGQNPAAGTQRGQNPAAGMQWGQNPASGMQPGPSRDSGNFTETLKQEGFQPQPTGSEGDSLFTRATNLDGSGKNPAQAPGGRQKTVSMFQGSSQTIPQQGSPQQGTAVQGYPQQGAATRGYPQQGTAAQGNPQQGAATQGYPQRGTSTQGYPQRGTSTQGYPQRGTATQHYPQQGTSQQGGAKAVNPGQGAVRTENSTASGQMLDMNAALGTNPQMKKPDRSSAPGSVSESLTEMVERVSTVAEGRTMSYFSVASKSQGNKTADPANSPAATTGADVSNETAKPSEEYIEPVVGWLVCMAGPNIGRDYRICAGSNSIGRGASNRIHVTGDDSISRDKHAMVIYEPTHRSFFLKPGDSSGLTYLNGEYIAESVSLSSGDMIGLGQSQFMFVPLCWEKFGWETLLKG